LLGLVASAKPLVVQAGLAAVFCLLMAALAQQAILPLPVALWSQELVAPAVMAALHVAA
jgi:hypothetical protein